MVGESENTARYSGINVKGHRPDDGDLRAICGLAALSPYQAPRTPYPPSTAGGRGFTAIIVAWLSMFNTFVMILVSLLLVFLKKALWKSLPATI